VPPGQTLTAPNKWPLLHFGPVPPTDLDSWDFKVFGLVENELKLSYPELRSLPAKEVVADIHCVTGWSRLGDTWRGVAIQEVLSHARLQPEAAYVMAYCEYGYTTSVPLEVLDDDDVLLCYGWNGEDLSEDHGFQLRLLVPKKYFWSRRSGSAASNSCPETGSASGSSGATTTRPTPGRNSATGRPAARGPLKSAGHHADHRLRDRFPVRRGDEGKAAGRLSRRRAGGRDAHGAPLRDHPRRLPALGGHP
jgi:hypothetical protein